MSLPASSSCLKYQERHWSENLSKSLDATPVEVTEGVDRIGEGDGLPFRRGLDLPGDVGGLTNKDLVIGLVGGDIGVAEGRS